MVEFSFFFWLALAALPFYVRKGSAFRDRPAWEAAAPPANFGGIASAYCKEIDRKGLAFPHIMRQSRAD
jgi:hypothetical protein